MLNMTHQKGNTSQNHNHLTSFRMVIIKNISIGEDVDKREPCIYLMGIEVVSATIENNNYGCYSKNKK